MHTSTIGILYGIRNGHMIRRIYRLKDFNKLIVEIMPMLSTTFICVLVLNDTMLILSVVAVLTEILVNYISLISKDERLHSKTKLLLLSKSLM